MSCYYAVAVTGGIGCGKSSVLEILKNASFEILDTDKIVHQILCENLDLKNKIIDEFGEQCLSIKGDINREVLGKIIFNSEEKRNVLNSLIHPIVRKKTLDWMTYCENKDFITAVEIPLLFECGWEKLNWNCIMSIEADTKIVKSRLLQRGLSKDDIDLRLRAQWPVKLKSELADISIQNNGTKEDLKKILQTWIKCLNKESAL